MFKIKCGMLLDPLSGTTKTDCELWIEDGKIIKQTQNSMTNADKEIDLSKCCILPGFVDAHNHLCFDIGDEVRQISEPLSYQALKAAKNAKIAINSGVTTLRDAGERSYVDFSVKRGIIEGLIPGPRLIVAGPGVMRTGGHMWYMGEEADGKDDVRKKIRRQLKAGVDFIKIFISGGATSQRTESTTPEMTQEEIDVAIYEAHTVGMSVGAHTHGGLAATWAIEAKVDSIEHGCFLTEDQLVRMKQQDIFLVVTSGVQRAISECKENSDFIREKARVAYENYINVVKRAIDLGLRLAIGNDTNHGCIAEEIVFLEKAGLSRLDALRIATYGGATLCGLDKTIGSLDVGKEADIIAFGSDPLTCNMKQLSPQWVFRSGTLLKTPCESIPDSV